MGLGTRYHHGDLRRALLDAARQTIGTHGADGLTLRGVARAAGVSHAAPYHHFRDKDALLAGVAEDGFRDLAVSVSARALAAEHPAFALQEAAIAYVVFAVENPALFRVMFGPQLADKTGHPALQAAANTAYRAIEGGLEQIHPTGEPSGRHSGHLAAASWSLIHGLAMLLIDGQFEVTRAQEAEQLARGVTDVFWTGLAHYGAGSSERSDG